MIDIYLFMWVMGYVLNMLIFIILILIVSEFKKKLRKLQKQMDGVDQLTDKITELQIVKEQLEVF